MSARSTRLRLFGALLGAAALFGLSPAAAAGRSALADAGVPADDAALRLRLEPGFRLPGAHVMIPIAALDPAVRPRDLVHASLVMLIDDLPAEMADYVEEVPAAVLVISDRDLASSAWVESAFLVPDSPHWLGLWDASADPNRHLPMRPAAGTPLPADLPEPAEPRLWDAVLQGIGHLAVMRDAPLRRVILVVGNLRQEQASERPMATCLEAARDLAIPVYGAVLDEADLQAAGRLRYLAENSGGDIVTATSVAEALAAGLSRITATGGLVLVDPGRDLPLVVSVGTGDGSPAVLTRVMQRPDGRFVPGPGMVAAVLILLAAGVGFLGWLRWRGRPVGFLIAADAAGPGRWTVPAAGLTIGRAQDNSLCLAEKKISKHHALVRWRQGQVQLIDLHSTNGTQVGGRPVRTAALNDGDTIILGDAVTLRFRRRLSKPQDRT